MSELDRQIDNLKSDLANCPEWKLTHEWGIYRAETLARLVARRDELASRN